MTHSRWTRSLLVLAMIAVSGGAAPAGGAPAIHAYFFDAPSCPRCEAAKALLDEALETRPQVTLTTIDVLEPSGFELAESLLDVAGIERSRVAYAPGMLVGGTYLDPGQDYDARPADGAYWCPPTEGSVVFVAGFLPFENMTAADCRAKLKEAYLASVSPDLPTGEPDAEGYIALLNGEDLEGWSPRGRSTDGWEIGAEGLEKAGHGGSDIFTNSTHLSCDLHVEFKVPERSNSGVYLQGRYEIQVLDSYEGALYPGACGGIYNTHAPSENASKPPGEWQSFDIDFTAATVDDDGRVVPARMTIKHNDVLIHDDREVPRATGGEMNRNYLQPGPVLLQGTHGPVTYRNIKLRPK